MPSEDWLSSRCLTSEIVLVYSCDFPLFNMFAGYLKIELFSQFWASVPTHYIIVDLSMLRGENYLCRTICCSTPPRFAVPHYNHWSFIDVTFYRLIPWLMMCYNLKLSFFCPGQFYRNSLTQSACREGCLTANSSCKKTPKKKQKLKRK